MGSKLAEYCEMHSYSKDALVEIIKAQDLKIERLENENRELKAEIASLESSLTNIASAKDAHIDDLTEQLIEAQAQLAVDREAINHNFNIKEAENDTQALEDQCFADAYSGA